MRPDPWARLERAAWAALLVHLAAGAAMALLLRPGLETNPDFAGRLAYLSSSRCLWTAGWLAWNAAALSILWFFFAFAEAYGTPFARFALTAACVGAAADLSAEALEMGLLPGLAARALGDPSAAGLFLSFHRAAELLTGCLANGLYTIAACLAASTGWKDSSAWGRAGAVGVGVFGAWLSAAALAGSASGMLLSNAGLVPAILAWLAGTALAARRRARG